MSQDNNGDGARDQVPKGWDTGAFWYPTADRQGALLGISIVLTILHFDEIFGIHTDPSLLFGWLPIQFAYHIFLGLVYVAFLYLLYLNWPSPSEEVTEKFDSPVWEPAKDRTGPDVDPEAGGD